MIRSDQQFSFQIATERGGGSYVAVLEESSTWTVRQQRSCDACSLPQYQWIRRSKLTALVFNFNYTSHLRYQLQLSYVIGELWNNFKQVCFAVISYTQLHLRKYFLTAQTLIYPCSKQHWCNIGSTLVTILGQYCNQYCPNIRKDYGFPILCQYWHANIVPILINQWWQANIGTI